VSAPSRTPVGVLAAGALLAAALPVALLAADVVSVLTEDYGGLELEGWSPPTATERLGQAFSTVAFSPVLLTALLGLVALAGLAIAGPVAGWRVALPVRVLGAVLSVVVALVAVAAVVGTLRGAQYGFDATFAASYAQPDAPVLGPLAFVAVFSLVAGTALVRPGRS
jgi:hypothetical protein